MKNFLLLASDSQNYPTSCWSFKTTENTNRYVNYVCIRYFHLFHTDLITTVGDDPTKWYPKDGGWAFHVASTVSEWVCAISFSVFMLTLVDEFKCISMDPPQVSCLCMSWEEGNGKSGQTVMQVVHLFFILDGVKDTLLSQGLSRRVKGLHKI